MEKIVNSFVEPSNARDITLEEINQKYSQVTIEKGASGLTKFFDYIITDEWIEVKQKIGRNADVSAYLGLKTIRIAEGTKPLRNKGSISLSKLVFPIASYKEANGSAFVEYVQQIRGIPAFNDEPLSILEYVQKYLVGKCLRCATECFMGVSPEFVNGKPTFFDVNGEKLREKEVYFFDVEEVNVEEMIKDKELM